MPSSDYKFGTLLLKRTIPSLESNQPPLRIAYRIIRPSLLQGTKAPLLVIHGGPSLPSEYLETLADNNLAIQNRSLILYDQLGCGWSSIPQQDEWYGVKQMARDLRELLLHLRENENVVQFHLIGHSLGGAIGYEYLKHKLEAPDEGRDVPKCLTVTLSNASTNFQLSDSERDRLFGEMQKQQTQLHQESSHNKRLQKLFFLKHFCRTDTIPPVLTSALSRRGKDWSAKEYLAKPLDSTICRVYPPILIIRGEYDFVTEACTRDWESLLANDDKSVTAREVVLKDCAHYPHLEQQHEYAEVLEIFCSSVEDNN